MMSGNARIVAGGPPVPRNCKALPGVQVAEVLGPPVYGGNTDIPDEVNAHLDDERRQLLLQGPGKCENRRRRSDGPSPPAPSSSMLSLSVV